MCVLKFLYCILAPAWVAMSVYMFLFFFFLKKRFEVTSLPEAYTHAPGMSFFLSISLSFVLRIYIISFHKLLTLL